MIDNVFTRIRQGLPVLIAEVGVNYYDIARVHGITPLAAAKMMVQEAACAGVHAVKFQSYRAETLAAKESPSYWDLNENPVTSQRELFSQYDKFGIEEYNELAGCCETNGVEFFSTAFDEYSADYLENMMNVYKISSSDLSNIPFIEYQAKKNKPILLSVGASNVDEIDLAVATIRRCNDKPIVLLHCVLEYPTPLNHANLQKIVSLKQRYPECIIGYSDHTRPTPDAIITNAAFLLGAIVIEKHFTLDKSLPGNDHFHAMDPADARNILSGFDIVNMVKGSGELVCLQSEMMSRRNARRSLVTLKAIGKGDVFTSEMFTAKRPGHGISPVKIGDVVGCKAACDIAADVVLLEGMVEKI